MDYEEFPVRPPLDRFARCAWTLRAPAARTDAEPPVPALPDGSPELILNLGDPFLAAEGSGPDRRLVEQPPAILVGQISRPFAVQPTGRIDLVAVRFQPFGAAPLFRPMRALTDRWADAAARVPAIADLLARLRSVVGTTQRLTLMCAMLERVWATGREPAEQVRAAVARVEATDGAVTVAELASAAGTTPRSLQRMFGVEVGITPKVLCRIRRFQRVFAAWRDDPSTWAAVAVRCGYFDQAHLVRDFHELAGAAPAGFVDALPEFTRMFTALGPGFTERRSASAGESPL